MLLKFAVIAANESISVGATPHVVSTLVSSPVPGVVASAIDGTSLAIVATNLDNVTAPETVNWNALTTWSASGVRVIVGESIQSLLAQVGSLTAE